MKHGSSAEGIRLGQKEAECPPWPTARQVPRTLRHGQPNRDAKFRRRHIGPPRAKAALTERRRKLREMPQPRFHNFESGLRCGSSGCDYRNWRLVFADNFSAVRCQCMISRVHRMQATHSLRHLRTR
jgi:hypothetical protein